MNAGAASSVVGQPPVFVITGPSGVGKGTLIRRLLRRHPGLALAISATTRPPRAGERDGVDYYFKSDAEFERLVAESAFIEHAEYSGHRYGTLRGELDRHIARGAGVVLEIELQGARQIRDALPGALQIFIAPPSVAALRDRLVGRGTDSAPAIERRMAVAEREIAARNEFACVVVNDDVEPAVRELDSVVSSRHAAAS